MAPKQKNRKGSATDPIAADQSVFAAGQAASEGGVAAPEGPSDTPKAAGEIDLDRFPVTPVAWRYLTARPESGLRGPFLYHVRKQNLARLAKAAGRQLTLAETTILVFEDRGGELVCGDAGHYDDVEKPTRDEIAKATFVGVVALVVAGEKAEDSDEGSEADEFVPIEGLPDEVAELIARHQDGSPKRWGPVALMPKIDPDTGRQNGWNEVPLCGARFYTLPDGRTVINNRSHLGVYIATMRDDRKRGIVYASEDAPVAAEIRQENAQRRREEQMDLDARRKKQYGLDRDRQAGQGRKVGTHGRTTRF